MRPEYLLARIALVANGVSMIVLYPLNMLVLERASWVWDYPDRNPAMEHMLVAIYVTMGAFLVWAARDPVKALSLIDFVIVSGAIHATTMAFDAHHMPSLSQHLAFRSDVMGTYVAPITLALTHPRRFYLLQWKRARASRILRTRPDSRGAWLVLAALTITLGLQLLAQFREFRTVSSLAAQLCIQTISAEPAQR